jgi:Na+/H+ antiporter NhaD/arsenite permease-like protein
LVSLIVLGIVFLLIAVRQVGRFRLRIWQIMLLGAIAVLAAGQISPLEGLRSINPDVMLFLFGYSSSGALWRRAGTSLILPRVCSAAAGPCTGSFFPCCS